ncbi:Frag1/DRAM/Sfk1 [Coprinopsis sp. MPI-PUGE-AT-0042]|nr:Frag1/DRAM/Sfk1 [Coprinopsis sp. MPI-PUGE-AT-0042]
MSRLLPLEHRHWLYAWVPLVTAFTWFGMLWAMLITWLVEGRPQYVSQDGSIAFISDIGADFLKPLFVAGCAVTGVGFVLCLVIERCLRHSARLVPHMRTRERVLSILAILGSVMAAAGLILLSIFDTKRHATLHRVFLFIFMLGVALSAIFTVIEFRWISKEYREMRALKKAYKLKVVLVIILIALAIAFGVNLSKRIDAAAVLEWTISFIFTFYILTYFYDLRQSKGVRKGELRNISMSTISTPNSSRA